MPQFGRPAGFFDMDQDKGCDGNESYFVTAPVVAIKKALTEVFG